MTPTATPTPPAPVRALRPLALLLAGLLALTVPLTAPAQADSTTTRLTVHKVEAPLYNPVSCPADGTVLPTDCTGDATPVPGVGFTLTLIPGTDPTTPTGQQAAATYQEDPTAAQAAATGPSHTGTTGPDGVLVLDALPAGLYLLTETSTPQNVTPALPTLVLLPATTTDGSWNRDVHVYPKNSVDTITISVLDDGVTSATDPALTGPAARHSLAYRILSTVPAPTTATRGQDGTVKDPVLDLGGTYTITDDLDPRLSYLGVALSVVGDTDADGDGAPDPLTDPTTGHPFVLTPSTPGTTDGHYTIWAVAADGTRRQVSATEAAGLPGGPTIVIELTPSGTAVLEAASLAAARTGGRAWVQTLLDTRVDSHAGDGELDGVIRDSASFTPSAAHAAAHAGAGIPSGTVETRLGDLTVLKTSTDGTTRLAGATFAVHEGLTGGGLAEACPASQTTGEHLLGTVTTGTDGTATLHGLQVSTYRDGADATDAARHYCLTETTAPDGYQLLGDSVPVDLTTPGHVTDPAQATATLSLDAPATGSARLVVNKPMSPPEKVVHTVRTTVTRLLARTGASTLGALTLAATLTVAGLLLLARRRREDAEG